MGNIGIIRDSSVLGDLLMQRRKQQMSLITVAQIAAIHGIINVRRRLTIVITTTVQVIKLEACAQSLSHVYAKERLEMVLTVDSVPAIVV